jgi:hypothetical protein
MLQEANVNNFSSNVIAGQDLPDSYIAKPENQVKESQADQDDKLLKLSNLFSKYYGVEGSEIDDMMKYCNEFYDAAKNLVADVKDETVRVLIDVSNQISAYSGFALLQYSEMKSGVNFIVNIITGLNSYHNTLFTKDPDSTKTTDTYETLACVILFASPKAIRQLIVSDFQVASEITKKMRKRPATLAVIISRMSELYVASKGDKKYFNQISSTLSSVLDFLASKDNSISGIPNAVDITFKELKVIIEEYMGMGNKRESLKSINNLINKKGDIGQLFYDWLILSKSCAIEILSLPEFNVEVILKFIKQLRIQCAVEMSVMLSGLPEEKFTIIEQYIASAYSLNGESECLNKLSEWAMGGSDFKYGILLRNISFLPNYYVDDGKSVIDGFLFLQSKLTSVANNLTATIAEKSLSITVSPMSRLRIYSDIVDQINKKNGIDSSAGSHLSKLMDKSVLKKIKEGSVSLLAIDQYSGVIMISMIESLIEVVQNFGDDFDIYKKDNYDILRTKCYKHFVVNYGHIMTKEYFYQCLQIIVSKVKSKPDINDIDEDEDED